MRPAAFLLALAACSPEIGPGTYYCGPEQYCPPDLACDPSTYTCQLPSSVDPFSCPLGTDAREPDDSTAVAFALGSVACGGEPLEGGTGCIDDGADEDWLELVFDRECQGSDPHLQIRVSFPIALVPLELALLDDQGGEVAAAEPCTSEPNYTGLDTLCLDVRPPDGTYYVRVRAAGHSDCDGDCRFNQYFIDVRHLLA
jgi:hypothetical protein